jgi:hypothetical protein
VQEKKNNNLLADIPILHNSDVPQREKSTGCHYYSDQKVKASLYKKNAEDEDYNEDFEEYS